MKAIKEGNDKTVSILCKHPNIEILNIFDKNGNNPIDISVYFGKISIFCKLLLNIFNKYNINNFNDINNNKYLNNIFNQKNINKWLNWCKKENNSGMYSFLTSLNDNAIINNNFQLLLSYITSLNEYEDENNENIIEIFNNIRSNEYISLYLFNNLKKESLLDINNVILNGLNNLSCSFNDDLLFLSNLINKKKFKNTIKNLTNKCLNNEIKTQESYMFFKKNLLNSNIWFLNSYNDDDNENNENENKDTDNDLLFNFIEKSVVLSELNKYKQSLKNDIIKLENEFNKQFKQLKYNIKKYNLGLNDDITQNKLVNRFDQSKDFMFSKGIKPLYSLKDIPFDNTVGMLYYLIYICIYIYISNC